jgi:general secretion pathway protein F
MTTFRFEAFSPTGQAVDGVVEAASLPDALSLLRQRGVSPYLAEPTAPGKQTSRTENSFSWRSLSLEWQARMFRQLATLLAAGITLDRALSIMGSQSKQKTEQIVLNKMLMQVSAGHSLSSALVEASSLFKADEVGLIKAGEQSGSLISVLEELSIMLERRLQLRGKLASALIYPAFLLALAPISLVIIATVLVPNIAPLFENSGASMPFVLRMMIWASDEFHTNGLYWLLAIIAILTTVYFALRNSPLRNILNTAMGKIPLVRTIRKRTEASRVSRTLGSLLRSGAPLQTAISAVIDISSSAAAQRGLRAARDAVSNGEKLATALKTLASLDSYALQMIAIGEETNRLDTMLLYVADTEEKALATHIDRIMVLLTPILTIVMGLFVGGIVMSIMKAILSINDLAAR